MRCNSFKHGDCHWQIPPADSQDEPMNQAFKDEVGGTRPLTKMRYCVACIPNCGGCDLVLSLFTMHEETHERNRL